MKITSVQNLNLCYTKNRITNNPVNVYLPKTVDSSKKYNELSNTFYYPLSFGKKIKENRVYSSKKPELFEEPTNFQICKHDNIPCPACGKLMLTREKFDKFIEELEETNTENYIDLLEKYKNYMRPIEQSVYEEIKLLSNENGVNDLRKLIVILRNSKLPQLQSIQMKKVKQMRSIAKNLPEKEKAELMEKLSKLTTQIKKKNYEAPFRRKKMIEEISNVKIANPFKYIKLQNIAKSFPASIDDNSAWIVKYSGVGKQGVPWTSKDIARRMLESSVQNVDHIIPYSVERNNDDLTNYMAMHCGCNGHKSNKSLIQWYNEDKVLRRKSMEAYFEKVDEIISHGGIEDKRYDDYVANATDTIRKIFKENR